MRPPVDEDPRHDDDRERREQPSVASQDPGQAEQPDDGRVDRDPADGNPRGDGTPRSSRGAAMIRRTGSAEAKLARRARGKRRPGEALRAILAHPHAVAEATADDGERRSRVGAAHGYAREPCGRREQQPDSAGWSCSPFAAQQRFPQTLARGRYAALRPIVYDTLGGSVAVLSQETATPFDRRDMSMTTLCRLRKSSRTCAVSATLLDRNR